MQNNKLIKILWRLSIIPYLISVLIMYVTVLPIRWLIIGEYRLKNKKDFPFMYKWGKKIDKK